MKKLGIVVCVLVLASASYAQTETTKSETPIERQIKVTEENGVTRLEETTTQNGVTRHEVFEGKAAEVRIAELKKIEAKEAGQIKRVEERKKAEKIERAPAQKKEGQIMD